MKFDKRMINLCLDLSENARLSPYELKKKRPEAIFIEDIGTDTQCFSWVYERVLYVSFRGTQQPKDWLTNFNGWHVCVPYGNYSSDIRVHRGFLRAYKSIRDHIHRIVQTTADVDQIVVCGHSLGGALATLCAVDIQYNFPYIDLECYVSGNPRVGNKAFARSYNKRVPKTCRTHVTTDVVPLCPPRWFEYFSEGGYTHTKHSNCIGPFRIFLGLWNLIKRRWKKESFAAHLANHSIALYRKYL